MNSPRKFEARYVIRAAILVHVLITTSCNRDPSSDIAQLLSGMTTTQLMDRIEGAGSPEQAAVAMAAGMTEKSPDKFLQHLCLGVCDGPISTINKYDECMHQKYLADESGTYSISDLPSQIIEGAQEAIETRVFDQEDPRVVKLAGELLSTYYGEEFHCVWLSARSHSKKHYIFRVVVTRVGNKWFAIPRCGSSNRFYDIADSMQLQQITSQRLRNDDA